MIPGLTNAAAHFQSTVEPIFKELRSHLKAWTDYFNVHTKDETTLLKLLRRFFEICKNTGLLISAKRRCMFAQEIKWSGRLVNGEGYTMDPPNVEGLRDMHEPLTADKLCEFIHCCRWMATAIPDFERWISPFSVRLEKAYAKAGKRKKRAIKSIALQELSWGQTERKAFRDVQDSLRNAVYLSYPRKGNVICVSTDASNNHWSRVVTQASPETLKKPFVQQDHEPLAFLGGTCKGA